LSTALIAVGAMAGFVYAAAVVLAAGTSRTAASNNGQRHQDALSQSRDIAR
jgi:hypothetical protein